MDICCNRIWAEYDLIWAQQCWSESNGKQEGCYKMLHSSRESFASFFCFVCGLWWFVVRYLFGTETSITVHQVKFTIPLSLLWQLLDGQLCRWTFLLIYDDLCWAITHTSSTKNNEWKDQKPHTYIVNKPITLVHQTERPFFVFFFFKRNDENNHIFGHTHKPLESEKVINVSNMRQLAKLGDKH